MWDLPDQTRTQPPAEAATPHPAHAVPGARGERRLPGRGSADGPGQQRRPDRVRRDRHRPSPLYRNAIGDECVYVESGSGVVETVFGAVSYRTQDYVLIPRATTHRWVPSEPSRLYAIEANSHIAPPKRYLSRFGQLLEHAPHCERDLHGPGETFLVDGSDVEVLVKHRVGGQVVGTRLTYAHPPVRRGRMDGCLYPLHVQRRGLHADHRQDPPAAAGAPGVGGPQLRGLQLPAPQGRLPPAGDPGALLPLNVDSDEVMFYVGGDYEARKGSGINLGSISLHPAAIAHGPSRARSRRPRRGEVRRAAVMIDTFPPLDLGEAAWRPRTRRTPGPGPASSPTPVRADGDGGPAVFSTPEHIDDDRRTAEILDPREVPLGGLRAMNVRRTLPQRSAR